MDKGSRIGQQLRAIRKAQGLTQQDLADRSGLARPTVNQIERDALAVGSKRLARLAAALGVSVLELAPEAEPDSPGLTLLDRQEELAADVVRLTKLAQTLARRVAALERRVPGGAQRKKAAS